MYQGYKDILDWGAHYYEHVRCTAIRPTFFRTCPLMLQVSVHRHLSGLSSFIDAMQVLVSWLMYSHMGNWELLLFSLGSCCTALAVCRAITWLCLCPVYRQTCGVNHFFPVLNSPVSLGAGPIC